MKTGAQKLVMLALLGSLIVLLVLIGGCTNGEVVPLKTQVMEDVTSEEAYALVQNNRANQNFAIIDVRTPEEYAGGCIEEAINLDYSSATFRNELNKLEKNKKYVIYCRSGDRSGIAVHLMKELGFSEVYNMLGGIIGWEARGNGGKKASEDDMMVKQEGLV